jgi:WD40 repeat protein
MNPEQDAFPSGCAVKSIASLRRALMAAAMLLMARSLMMADVYVSGFNSGGVYRFDDAGTPVGTGVFIAPGSGGLSLPHGVMRLADGTIIVASAGSDEVLRYSPDGAYLSEFIANGENGVPAGTLDYPVDFAIGPGGDLFVTSQLNDRVLRFNAATGAFISIFASGASIDGPSGLAWSAANDALYVVGRFGNSLVRFNNTGGTVGGFSPAVLGQPFGIAIHPVNAELLVANGNANQVRRLNAATGATIADYTNSLGLPIGVRFGPDGDFYVASFGDDRIARFDGTTFAVKTDLIPAATATSVGLDGPNFFSFIHTALENWRVLHFSTTANSGNAANNADPDGDQWNNLLEFATGRSPTTAEQAFQPVVAGGVLRYDYPRNIDAVNDGWLFTVEWSDTMTGGDWHTGDVTESVLSTSGNLQAVRAEIPLGAAGRRFVRLRVHQ